MHKMLMTFIVTLIFVIFFPTSTFALQTYQPVVAGVDIIIALDCTGSMKTNDPNKWTVDGALLLLDSLPDKENSRFGVVFFDSEIRSVIPLESLPTSVDINRLKDNISNVYGQDGAKTDTVRALMRSFQDLDPVSNRNPNPKMVVLITDGIDDPVRSANELENERNFVVSAFKEAGIPIYSIGLNYNNAIPEEGIQKLTAMSNETNGKHHTVTRGQDIPSVINEIYNHFIGIHSTRTWGSFGAEPTVIPVNIEDQYVMAAIVTILSESKVTAQVLSPDGRDVTGDAALVYIGQSPNRYTTIQLLWPEKGDWTITARGEAGLSYIVDIAYDYKLNISARAAGADGSLNYSQGNARLECWFSTETGAVTDYDIYQNSSAVFELTFENGTNQAVPATLNNEGIFTADVSHLPAGTYEVRAKIIHKSFTRDMKDPYILTLGESTGTETAPETESSAERPAQSLGAGQSATSGSGGSRYTLGDARLETWLNDKNRKVTDLSLYNDVREAAFTITGPDGATFTRTAKLEGDIYTADVSDLEKGKYEVIAKITMKDGTEYIPRSLMVLDLGKGISIWLIIAIIAAILLIGAVVLFMLGILPNPIAKSGSNIGKEFIITIDNDVDGRIDREKTDVYFIDKANADLKGYLRFHGRTTKNPDLDKLCGDIWLRGRMDRVLITTKNKKITIEQPHIIYEYGGDTTIYLNDENNTRIHIYLK